MLYIKLFIEREKNTGQSAPECPFNVSAYMTVISMRITTGPGLLFYVLYGKSILITARLASTIIACLSGV